MNKEGKAVMRKNRKNNVKKERAIMIASSVFVLSALTMTGIYMKSSQTQEQDDGYTIDFTALENNVEDKYQEIAQSNSPEDEMIAQGEGLAQSSPEEFGNPEDDLDYMPMEAGSGLVTIPGLTDGQESLEDSVEEKPKDADQKKDTEKEEKKEADATATPDAAQEQETESPEDADAAPEATPDSIDSNAATAPTLHFAESEGLMRPVSGEVLIPFSMDGGVYFSTLDQFKYNPALIMAAETGSAVSACADGKVISIFDDAEIGHALTVELGDGYQITYGQLDEIRVTEGSYVEPGEIIAFIASPTKYFSVEGSNLYLKLTMNGVPVDPEGLLR